MLMKRLISGGILASVLLVIILYLPEWVVAFTFGLIFAIGGCEWARMTCSRYRIPYTALISLIIAILWFFSGQFYMPGLFLFALLIWALILVAIVSYTKTENPAHRGQSLLALAGLVILPVAWLGTLEVYRIQPFILVYVFAIAGFADSFAYVAGKKYGRRKLAPDLSPNKTVEGVFGGLAAVFLLALIAAVIASQPASVTIPFVILSMVCALVSVIGDLFVSMMKREAGVKDAGHILPGHGGILDRFDSHLAVIPLFYLGLYWILGNF